jgi:hypothetical protein
VNRLASYYKLKQACPSYSLRTRVWIFQAPRRRTGAQVRPSAAAATAVTWSGSCRLQHRCHLRARQVAADCPAPIRPYVRAIFMGAGIKPGATREASVHGLCGSARAGWHATAIAWWHACTRGGAMHARVPEAAGERSLAAAAGGACSFH